jgi:hypothetical protein
MTGGKFMLTARTNFTCHKATELKQYSSTLSLTSAVNGGDLLKSSSSYFNPKNYPVLV